MTKADVQAYKAKWDTFRTRAGDAVKKGVSKEEFMANVRQDDLGWNLSAGSKSYPFASHQIPTSVSDSSAKLEPSPR